MFIMKIYLLRKAVRTVSKAIVCKLSTLRHNFWCSHIKSVILYISTFQCNRDQKSTYYVKGLWAITVNSYRNEEVEEYGMITGMPYSRYTVGFEVLTAAVLNI
jgi:hypothetical protein